MKIPGNQIIKLPITIQFITERVLGKINGKEIKQDLSTLLCIKNVDSF